MITVEEALSLIKEHCIPMESILIPIEKANGRILDEEITADRDFPPYDRVTMDGIAINFKDYENSVRKFHIQDVAPAGSPQKEITETASCIEVMTGAILPKNADTVIRYEDLRIEDGYAHIWTQQVIQHKNIHTKGSDTKKDTSLLTPGRKLSPADISIAAAVGKHKIKVKKSPKVTVITTGDELVDIDQIPAPYQVRKSNGIAISAFLSNLGIHSERIHLMDDLVVIKSELAKILEDSNMVILSGGVSKGKFDFIPEAMEQLGVKKVFHKVRQRPGKPLWFGVNDSCIVFGLPGNPVSSFMCTHKYISYCIAHMTSERSTYINMATLSEDYTFNPKLTLFLPVKLETSEDGVLLATPKPGNGSGDFINLKDADAILELPADKVKFRMGECYPVVVIR